MFCNLPSLVNVGWFCWLDLYAGLAQVTTASVGPCMQTKNKKPWGPFFPILQLFLPIGSSAMFRAPRRGNGLIQRSHLVWAPFSHCLNSTQLSHCPLQEGISLASVFFTPNKKFLVFWGLRLQGLWLRRSPWKLRIGVGHHFQKGSLGSFWILWKNSYFFFLKRPCFYSSPEVSRSSPNSDNNWGPSAWHTSLPATFHSQTTVEFPSPTMLSHSLGQVMPWKSFLLKPPCWMVHFPVIHMGLFHTAAFWVRWVVPQTHHRRS